MCLGDKTLRSVGEGTEGRKKDMKVGDKKGKT